MESLIVQQANIIKKIVFFYDPKSSSPNEIHKGTSGFAGLAL